MEKILSFNRLFYVGLMFYNLNINSLDIQKPKREIKSEKAPLPLSYQVILQELAKSKDFLLSPSTKDLVDRNYDSRRFYNIIKNYTNLGLSKDEARKFYQKLLHLNLIKFNALINFIEEIQKTLNYENFPLPEDFADKYSERALAAMDEVARTSAKNIIMQQDINEIRKIFLKYVILFFVFGYGISWEIIQERLEYLYITLSNLNKAFFENSKIKEKIDGMIKNLLKTMSS